ncbi:MAG: histidine ammonia-lyase [Bryobacterales bacterium]|nr:histidine ammonia-lyase [Bryobacterales bacterium]
MVILNGEGLTLPQVGVVAVGNEQVSISEDALRRMADSRGVVEALAAGEEPVYAVNTGVGLLADRRITAGELEHLQRNVVRSHACGIGEPLAGEVVRAMMLIRANVLAKGLSGIRPVAAERLCDLLNRGVTPVVPSRGSVGASGDLAPLAHIALVLMGEGEAEYEGRRLKGGDALRLAGLEPLVLAPKEGISLINGTQAMLAIGCLELEAGRRLAVTADVLCALTTDSLHGTPRAFDPRAHAARPHRGQIASAERMRRLMEGSEIRESHIHCPRVQDAYALRCAPQVHGAVHDAIQTAAAVFAIELNSATDNPLVFDNEILSAGNFHGEPVALQLDYLAIALTALAGISERRVDRLVNPALSEGLPPFLAREAGLESGYMMPQVTAAALVGENRVLASPATVGSIPTSGNKEDFVSMGMASALKLQQIVRNTRHVLAIEALCAARALEFLRPLRTSPRLEQVHHLLRLAASEPDSDAPFTPRIEAVAKLIASGVLTDV